MKLAIVGGSAASTPSLFLTESMQALLQSLETVLIGRSAERLQAVRRALAATVPALRVSCAEQDAVETAITGADVILLQARYGGMTARAYDESFPRAYGIPGDEGLGPGGLSAAWRAWPELRDLLQTITTYAPHARIIAMTAPLGILAHCVLSEFPALQWYAVCELPYATLRGIARATNVPFDDISYEYIGVNHLGWFDDVRDRCIGSSLVARFAETLDERHFPPRSLVLKMQAVPLKYERLSYDAAAVVAEQSQRTRADDLLDWQRLCFEAFETGTPARIAGILRERDTPWYRFSVGPLIAAFAGEARDEHFFFTTRNNGYIPALGDDDVIEVPYRIAGAQLQRVERRHSRSAALLEELRSLARYEQLAARAVRLRDEDGITEVLSLHPWVPSNVAESLAEAIIAGPGAPSGSTPLVLQDSR